MIKKLLLPCLICMSVCAVSSCSPENKSVTEPLNESEIEKIAEKHESFERVYQTYILPGVENEYENSPFREKLKKLTYSGFMKFYERWLDPEWNEEAKRRAEREWDERYSGGKLDKRIGTALDSVVGAWEKFYDENSLNSYFSIELSEIRKNTTTAGEAAGCSAIFKIVPLKGEIDYLSLGYALFRTENEPPYNLADRIGGGVVTLNEPFRDEVEIESRIDVTGGAYGEFMKSWAGYVQDTPSEKIKEECKLDVDVAELAVKGKKLTWDEIYQKKPYAAIEYRDMCMKGDTASPSYERAKDSFIREYIDRNYAKKSLYVLNRSGQMLYETDPLAYTLLNGKEKTEICLRNWGMERPY